MTPAENAELAATRDTFTIYRGFNGDGTPYGLSWTTQRTTAEWFARRFLTDDSAHIASATVTRADVIALFTRRGEHEIVVHPDTLTDVTTEALN